LNASPCGGAIITMTVNTHFKMYDSNGVLNGFVDAHKWGNGRIPCLDKIQIRFCSTT